MAVVVAVVLSPVAITMVVGVVMVRAFGFGQSGARVRFWFARVRRVVVIRMFRIFRFAGRRVGMMMVVGVMMMMCGRVGVVVVVIRVHCGVSALGRAFGWALVCARTLRFVRQRNCHFDDMKRVDRGRGRIGTEERMLHKYNASKGGISARVEKNHSLGF